MIPLREGEAAINSQTGEMTIGPTPPELLLRHDPAAKGRSRNLPCQCGSGLKTKKCHGHGPPETVRHNDSPPADPDAVEFRVGGWITERPYGYSATVSVSDVVGELADA